MLHDQIVTFYKNLHLDNSLLPPGISVMNPYSGRSAEVIIPILEKFYQTFYNKPNERYMILGINPGRHGAGQTGLMFTDTIHLNRDCKIPFDTFESRELSSEFFYKAINTFGGSKTFFNNFYVSAVSPLGFLYENDKGKQVNYNYYDSKKLLKSIEPFIHNCLNDQLKFNINTRTLICLGNGKNFHYLENLNNKLGIFKNILSLEHPRFIMQYKRKHIDKYLEKYRRIFNETLESK